MLRAAIEKMIFHMDDAVHGALKDLALAILNSSNLLWLMIVMPITEDETPIVLIMQGEGQLGAPTPEIEDAYQRAQDELCSFERACGRDYQLIIAPTVEELLRGDCATMPIRDINTIAEWLANVQIGRQRAVAEKAV